MNKDDYILLEEVRNFNKFDLYSKEDDCNITDKIKSFYDNLLDKFFFGELNW